MMQLLAKLFIRERGEPDSPATRRAYGILCGFAGIFFNLMLCTGKLIVGALSKSIAITADALNNLSDIGSSLVTLVGFKLAGKRADSDHPFGHGRYEYISGLIVSLIIIVMGIELAKSSVEKILTPDSLVFSTAAVAVLIASISVKAYMSLYNRRIGTMINSAAMRATAIDSLSDCAATSMVLISTLVWRFFGVNIDGWCGVGVALFICYSGFRAARETISPLLGATPDAAFVKKIEELVLENENIVGLHDLVVHDYGPGRTMISLHVEVPADCDFVAMHDTIDNIERRLSKFADCTAVIHMDPVVKDDARTAALRERLNEVLKGISADITMHDFRIVPGHTHTNLVFDALVPFTCPLSDDEVRRHIYAAVAGFDGDYYAVVNIDRSEIM